MTRIRQALKPGNRRNRTMTHRNHSTATHAPSNAGLILSLVEALPNPSCPLARRARAVAHHGSAAQAGDILADLLSATDCGLVFDDDSCLDESWDA